MTISNINEVSYYSGMSSKYCIMQCHKEQAHIVLYSWSHHCFSGCSTAQYQDILPLLHNVEQCSLCHPSLEGYIQLYMVMNSWTMVIQPRRAQVWSRGAVYDNDHNCNDRDVNCHTLHTILSCWCTDGSSRNTLFEFFHFNAC